MVCIVAKVGGTAAFIVSRMAHGGGKIATLVGGHRYRGPELSEIGFRSYSREIGEESRLLETMVNIDDPEVTREITTSLLDRHAISPQFTMEAADATASFSRSGATTVANDLTVATRSALIDGIITCVLCLPIDAFARAVVDEMVASLTGQDP